MKRYGILLPVVGHAYLEIEADTEEEALNLAYDRVGIDDIEEWDCPEEIVSGNVFHGTYNKIEIDEI